MFPSRTNNQFPLNNNEGGEWKGGRRGGDGFFGNNNNGRRGGRGGGFRGRRGRGGRGFRDRGGPRRGPWDNRRQRDDIGDTVKGSPAGADLRANLDLFYDKQFNKEFPPLLKTEETVSNEVSVGFPVKFWMVPPNFWIKKRERGLGWNEFIIELWGNSWFRKGRGWVELGWTT